MRTQITVKFSINDARFIRDCLSIASSAFAESGKCEESRKRAIMLCKGLDAQIEAKGEKAGQRRP